MSNNINSKYKALIPTAIAIILVIGLAIGTSLPRKSDKSQLSFMRQRIDKISNVLNIIESSYVDSIDKDLLEETAIDAILRHLDPHSIYMSAKELAKANEPLQGNFDGIGVSFNTYTDTVLIISTIVGGPSQKVGIQAGDKIIYVNDSLIAGQGISDDDIMGLLKGPKGSTVNVKVQRDGFDDLLSFDIIRDKIPIYSIDVAYMENENTGYVKISSFALTTHEEFKEALKELKSQGMKNLIVDLRDNSGGIMDAAIQIANEFLDKGQLIVYTEGRSQPRSEARATGLGSFRNGKLVILIDEWSASASEILAGAIQDNDRGTIIGRRSYGKGLVQEPVSFMDGSGLRLTVARYYTPSGRSIQKPFDKGVEEYFADLETRFLNREFEVADSIHFPDSLKYYTTGGRVVYGGGGIMPDKFVPVDTIGVTNYLVRVRPYIYEYAMRFTEKHRQEMNAYNNVDDLEAYLNKHDLINQFTTYVSNNYNIPTNNNELRLSRDIIHNQIKAYIARNIVDNKGFYPLWNKNDATLKYAVDFLEKDGNQ